MSPAEGAQQQPKPRRGKRYPIASILAAIKDSKGLISKAAEILEVSTDTLHRRIKGNLHLEASLSEARSRNLDVAEAKLMEAVEKGEAWAIQFYLRCLGKQRGYVERTEHQQINDHIVRIVFGPAPAKAEGE